MSLITDRLISDNGVKPVLVTVEGDEVVIQYPEESTAARAEAARLAERAGKRAAEGNYEKAIGIGEFVAVVG